MDESHPSGEHRKKTIIPYSEALEKTGFGIFNCVLILICGLALANEILETSSVGYILPIAECDLRLTNGDKGLLTAIGYIGIIVSSHLWGFLADTKGRRAIILPTLLISFAVTVVSSFAKQFWILVFFRFVNGFFVSGTTAAIYAYVDEFHIDRTKSRAIMASSVVMSFGTLLLPVIAWGVINQSWSVAMPFFGIVYKPWRLFMVACGFPGIVCGLALLLYPESPKFLLSIGYEREAIEVLKKMYRWNLKSGQLMIDGIIPERVTTVPNINKSSPFTVMSTMWNQTAPLFQGHLLRSTMIICMIQFWIYVTIHGMYMWFPYIVDTMVGFMKQYPGNETRICDIIYTNQREVFEENGIQHCTERLEDTTYMYGLIMELMFPFGFAFIGIIVTRMKETLILFVFGACGVIAINISDPQISLYFYVIFFACGLGIQVLGGTTAELYPTHLKGMVLCISLMFGRLGGVVGGVVAGLLLDNNCELTFYIAGIALIACGFLPYLIPKHLKTGDINNT